MTKIMTYNITELNSKTRGELQKLIRDLKKTGLFLGYTGTQIAYLSKAQCAEMACGCPHLDSPEPTPAPAPAPEIEEEEGRKIENSPIVDEVPESADPLGAMLAGLIGPHIEARVNQTTFDAMLVKSEKLADRLQKIESQRVKEIVIKHEDGGKPEINVGVQHCQFERLLKRIGKRKHCYLPGPAGSGKTTAAYNVAKALGLECSAKSVCAQTSEVAFLGYNDANGNYITTEFRKRYETGGVFILDEIDNGNPNTTAVLNSALANGECAFADGMVAVHPDFILVATANTVGLGANAQFVGRNPIDGATIDRFCFIDWQQDPALELHIAKSINPSKGEEIAGIVQGYRASAAKLRSKVIISPRATFGICECFDDDTFEELELEFLWRGTPPDEIAKIKAGVKKGKN